MKYLILITLFISNLAIAKAPSESTLKVVYQVAKEFNIDAQLLIKIAAIESTFNIHAKRVNKNNTVDIGMFQINSVHWTTTCKKYDIFTLKGNTQCAATIIKGIERHKQTDPNWKGRYHSKTPSRKLHYANLIRNMDLTKYQ